MSVVEVKDLRVEVVGRGCDVVDDISFSIERGRVLGIVGESGSGKTTVVHALMGNARRGTRITRGSVVVGGVEVLTMTPEQLQALRGRAVAYVPQDPSVALNPSIRIGRQMMEPFEFHETGLERAASMDRIRQGLAEVALPNDDEFLGRYPHQLSGGQQQRVLLAIAFLLRPGLVVLDEPTTGLDVTTQAQVLRVAAELFDKHGVAAVYVTHDLSVVAQVATETMVMYSGRVVEYGPTQKLFEAPSHPYTRRLMAASLDVATRHALRSIPGHSAPPGERPSGCFFHPRCDVAVERCRTGAVPTIQIASDHTAACHLALELPAAGRTLTLREDAAVPDSAPAVISVENLIASYGHREVLHDVSVRLRERECLVIVGQSGSGKTTLARCIIGLHRGQRGSVKFRDVVLAQRSRDRPDSARREIQYIFQSPYGSLNARQTCGDIVALPIRFFDKVGRREARNRTEEALIRVGLTSRAVDRYPDELSGGERQRVAIARALVCRPHVLICDEVTSALDVSVQATILELLRRLQQEEGLSMIFITHNLAIVRNMADRVVVMQDGVIVEAGEMTSVLDEPGHRYTKQLLADTPVMPNTAIGV